MKISTLSQITATVAAGLAFAASAQAQNVQVRQDDAARARANMEASVKAAARGQKVGMISGRLNPKPVVHANGTVAQELDASTMTYSVARRRADGSVEMVCVDGADAAAKALKAPALAQRHSSTAKEHADVK